MLGAFLGVELVGDHVDLGSRGVLDDFGQVPRFARGGTQDHPAIGQFQAHAEVVARDATQVTQRDRPLWQPSPVGWFLDW